MLTFACLCMLLLGLSPLALYLLGKIKDPLNPLILVGAASYFVSAHQLLIKPGPAMAHFEGSTYAVYVFVAFISLLGYYAGWYIAQRRDQTRFDATLVTRTYRPDRLIAFAGIAAVVPVIAAMTAITSRLTVRRFLSQIS